MAKALLRCRAGTPLGPPSRRVFEAAPEKRILPYLKSRRPRSQPLTPAEKREVLPLASGRVAVIGGMPGFPWLDPSEATCWPPRWRALGVHNPGVDSLSYIMRRLRQSNSPGNRPSPPKQAQTAAAV